MPMRALVTGATGFIGSHMVEFLLTLGWEVVCPIRDIGSLGHLRRIAVEVVSMDALPDLVLTGPAFDYVFHIAGAVYGSDYQAFRKANVELTVMLLDLFGKSRHRHLLKRFALVSSQAAAGPSPADGSPGLESEASHPVSLYGKSKLEAEQAALAYRDAIPVTIVRPSTVFGPRDRNVLFFFRAARYHLAPYVAGAPGPVSIIYVSDLVQGLIAAALSPHSIGETYFMAHPDPVMPREFGRCMARLMGHHAIPLPLPKSVLKILGICGGLFSKFTGSPSIMASAIIEDVVCGPWFCSVEKACEQLDWRAQTPLDEAMLITIQWYREHGWL